MGVIVRKFRNIACLGIVFGCATATPVFADLIRNPLYDLDKDICLLDKDKTPKSKFVVQVWESATGELLSSAPDSDARAFLQVNREHLLQKMLNRYPIRLDYMALQKEGASIAEWLADAVAPCKVIEGDAPKSQSTLISEIDKTKEEKSNDPCVPDELYKSDDLRFEKKDSNLRFRRALLRLFHVAETGSSRDFIVLRRNISPFKTTIPTESHPKEAAYKPWSALTYRPLLNAGADDVMLRKFITDESPPFVILCRGRADDDPSGGEGKDPDKIVRYSALVTEKAPISDLGAAANVPNAVKPIGGVSMLGDFMDELKTGSKKSTKTYDQTIKLTIVKSAADFVKSEPDKAEIGIAEDSAGDTISAFAAVGVKFERKSKAKANQPQLTQSVIPFFSIQQEPTTEAFFQVLENGRSRASSRKIAFANITGGIRYEREWNGPVVTAWQSLSDTRFKGAPVGKRTPGWRWGITGEAVTDNYKFQRGERYGVDVSLPRWWSVKGFRQREEIFSRNFDKPGQDKGSNITDENRFPTTWAIQWDVRPAIDYVDWDEGRTPFNFTSPQPNDGLDDAVFNTALLGGDFELELLKANLFGSVLGDAWLKLSADYSFRYGYNDSEVRGVTVRNKSAHRFEMGAELSHSDFSNLSFGVDFATGENFKTLADTENITFNVKAKY